MPSSTAATKRFRSTRNFAICAVIVVVIAGGGIAWQQSSRIEQQITDIASRSNTALTTAFANALWPRHGEEVDDARTLDPAAWRETADFALLFGDVVALMQGTKVLKVKLYDRHGYTAFSTAPEQVGGDYGANERFLAARDGRTASVLEFRAAFGTPQGLLSERWVVSSYVPLRANTINVKDALVAVAEIYADVTEFRAALVASARVDLLLQLAILGAGLALLTAMVAYADGQIERWHQRALHEARAAEQAEAASRAKSEFLAHMSHELRTPLNAVIGFADMIERATFGPVGHHKYREYAGDIVRSGQHLLAIIADVLDFARVETGRLQAVAGPMDATKVAREAAGLVRDAAAKKAIDLAMEIPDERLAMASDADKIRQILINLLHNAIKFTRSGGRVRLRLQRSGAGSVLFEVIDTGIGMKPEELPRALMPFVQLKSAEHAGEPGAGLGLALSKRMAELLGGGLELQSVPGHGTTVRLTLPREIPQEDLPERRAASA